MIREMDTMLQDWYLIKGDDSGRFTKADYTCLACDTHVKYRQTKEHVESHGLILNHEERKVECKVRSIK